MRKESRQFLKLKADVGKETRGLLFLVNTGADVSLIKRSKLKGATEFNPEAKFRIKCVDGSPMETDGTVDANIEIGREFQLVHKQVDLPCDGIVGRDFLQRTQAKICYATGTVILLGEGYELKGEVKLSEQSGSTVRQIWLPRRTERLLRVQVALGSPQVGMTQKRELKEGVFLAATLTKAVDGYALMSVLRTNDIETEVQEPVVEVEEVEPEWETPNGAEFESQDRETFSPS